MKKIFIISLLTILFSCNDQKTEKENIASAEAYYQKAKKDTTGLSFYYFNQAKNFYSEAKDSVGIAKALVNMAILQEQKGDYYGSIETSLEAVRYLGKNNDSIRRRTSASNFNNMAICSSYLYEFDDCIKYYKKAIQYTNIQEDKYTFQNNLGVALITLEKYKEAIQTIQLALPTKDSLKYAMVINNLARVKHYDNQNYNPLPAFYKALEIRKRSNSSVDENSSYATLANYFFYSDRKKALYYAKQMLNAAKKNKSSEDQLQALQKIINLTPDNHLVYFESFQALNDSVQVARSKAKNQFAKIRYDVEKNNAENQRLKANNSEKENKILLLLIALVLAIITILWYRKRQIRLKQEKELEVKNTQLKMSKKVHDVVANGIYQVMTKIENQESFDKEKALDELEFVYEKSRDISYDKPDQTGSPKDCKEKISKLIASFKNDDTETYTGGNEDEIWTHVSQTDFEEIYQVIRELLVNMKKHSQASRVVFKFERTENQVRIQYTDNGLGIPGDLIQKNGLTNTVSRMAAIKGAIIFDTKTEKGLKISISFPVS